MISSYPLFCHHHGCGRLAEFKIAARWSDGLTGELKTYFLSCPSCLTDLLRLSRAKQAACRLAPGEILEPPGVYELRHGNRDRELARRPDLETTSSADADPPG